MDARHITLAQQISNEIIQFINRYVQDNTDDILSQHDLLEDLKEISKCLYEYADMTVDVESIFSKRNILSIDTVFLPHIEEGNLYKQRNTVDYMEFIEHVKSHVSDRESEGNDDFYDHVFKILSRHHS
jgi:hypothetical protein